MTVDEVILVVAVGGVGLLVQLARSELASLHAKLDGLIETRAQHDARLRHVEKIIEKQLEQ